MAQFEGEVSKPKLKPHRDTPVLGGSSPPRYKAFALPPHTALNFNTKMSLDTAGYWPLQQGRADMISRIESVLHVIRLGGMSWGRASRPLSSWRRRRAPETAHKSVDDAASI